MAMGHVILREFHLDRQVKYFEDYCRKYTDMPMLVAGRTGRRWCPSACCAPPTSRAIWARTNNPEWKTVAIDEATRRSRRAAGSIGFRWGEQGKWNLEEKDGKGGDVKLRLTLDPRRARHEVVDVAFPYFGNREHDHFAGTDHPDVLTAQGAGEALSWPTARRWSPRCSTCSCANYGLDRGLGGETSRQDYDDDVPYTPAWAEKITGVPRDQIIAVAREFAANAEKTNGKSMVILGAGDEPLVPHGHELPRHHQHAGDVRLRRPVGRRLVALCRPGEAAPADRLDAAGLRARLEPSAAADELDLASSTPTPTSGATRRWGSAKSCRRPRPRATGTAA
jgi:nitrate reductase alpha subunit